METATNLKRRRSSREGAAKKVCSGPTCPEDPLEGPSHAFLPKPKHLPQQAPPNLQIPPPVLSLPPPILPLPPPPPLILPPPPPPPQYRTPQHAPPEQKRSQPSQSPQPPELSHHPPQPTKTRPHQIARSQSHERLSQRSLLRTFSLPSLSPSSSPELFPAALEKEPAPAPEPVKEVATADPAPRKSRRQTKTKEELTEEQCRKAVALCTIGPESVTHYQPRKTLKPLLDLEKIHGKKICDPTNFRSAPMVTTFVRSSGDRSKGVWKFLDVVSQTNTGVVLAELEHSSLKRCLPFCAGRTPF